MDINDFNHSGKKEDYSCSRCRRLKKKCTRNSPSCSQCLKSSETCSYPGRAPRRTKKELKEAMLRGDFVPLRKGKNKNSVNKPTFYGTSTSLTPEELIKNKKTESSISGNDTPAVENKIAYQNAPLPRYASNSPPPSLMTFESLVTTASKQIPSVNAKFSSNQALSLTNPQSVSTTATATTSPQPSITFPNPQIYDNVSSLVSALSTNVDNKHTSNNNNNNNSTTTTTTNNNNNVNSPIQLSNNQSPLGLNNNIPSPSLFTINSPPSAASPMGELPPLTARNRNSTKNLPPFSTMSPAYHPNTNLINSFNNTIPTNDPNMITSTQVSPTNSNQITSITPSSNVDVVVGVATPTHISLNDNNNNDNENNNQLFNDYHNVQKMDSTPIQSSSIEIETIGNVFKGGRTTTWINEDGSYKAIERTLLDRFIAAYFRHNHRLFPMIDKIAFLNQVASINELTFEKMEQEFDDVFIFKLYMIMAIGCTTLRRAGMLLKDEEELSEHLAFLSMKKFCFVINLQNIETIRCLILLGIYSFFEPKGWSSWTISGIIMRLTIGLGLNRDLIAKKLKTVPATEVEARYRVFWSAYCYERLVSTCLGRVSAIEDDDITIPTPRPLYDGEKDDIDVTNTMIQLRKLAGRIYKEVHSVSVGKKNLTIQEKNNIIANLRNELDSVFEKEKIKLKKHNEVHQIINTISFHSSDIWLAMRYSQLMILLYRPSVLIPKPPIESLSILGQYCLEAWKHTYTLYQKKLLPLNWITLFRTLTICNIILYCLCQWSIDLIESKIEIQQCVEILEHFGSKWVFAKKCAEVFQNISNTILDISLSDGKVPNMDKLTSELFGANDAYHDILDENNVDVSWVDKLM